MDVHTHIMQRIALLPDEELKHLLHAVRDTGAVEIDEERASRRSRVEVISRELSARGILGPPWWIGTHRSAFEPHCHRSLRQSRTDARAS